MNTPFPIRECLQEAPHNSKPSKPRLLIGRARSDRRSKHEMGPSPFACSKKRPWCGHRVLRIRRRIAVFNRCDSRPTHG